MKVSGKEKEKEAKVFRCLYSNFVSESKKKRKSKPGNKTTQKQDTTKENPKDTTDAPHNAKTSNNSTHS